jgi:predicted restriction endonuclease
MNKNDAQNHVPKKLLDVLEFIENVFKAKNWKKELKDNDEMLQEVFGRASKKDDSSEPVNNYEAPLKV